VAAEALLFPSLNEDAITDVCSDLLTYYCAVAV
jgi:hypothetical protein